MAPVKIYPMKYVLLMLLFALPFTGYGQDGAGYVRYAPEFEFSGGHGSEIVKTAINKKLGWIASIDKNNKAIVWDIETKMIFRTFEAVEANSLFKLTDSGFLILGDVQYFTIINVSTREIYRNFCRKNYFLESGDKILSCDLLFDLSTPQIKIDTLYKFGSSIQEDSGRSKRVTTGGFGYLKNKEEKILLTAAGEDIFAFDADRRWLKYQFKLDTVVERDHSGNVNDYRNHSFFTLSTDGKLILERSYSMKDSLASIDVFRLEDGEIIRQFIDVPFEVAGRYLDSLGSLGIIDQTSVLGYVKTRNFNTARLDYSPSDSVYVKIDKRLKIDTSFLYGNYYKVADDTGRVLGVVYKDSLEHPHLFHENLVARLEKLKGTYWFSSVSFSLPYCAWSENNVVNYYHVNRGEPLAVLSVFTPNLLNIHLDAEETLFQIFEYKLSGIALNPLSAGKADVFIDPMEELQYAPWRIKRSTYMSNDPSDYFLFADNADNSSVRFVPINDPKKSYHMTLTKNEAESKFEIFDKAGYVINRAYERTHLYTFPGLEKVDSFNYEKLTKSIRDYEVLSKQFPTKFNSYTVLRGTDIEYRWNDGNSLLGVLIHNEVLLYDPIQRGIVKRLYLPEYDTFEEIHLEFIDRKGDLFVIRSDDHSKKRDFQNSYRVYYANEGEVSQTIKIPGNFSYFIPNANKLYFAQQDMVNKSTLPSKLYELDLASSMLDSIDFEVGKIIKDNALELIYLVQRKDSTYSIKKTRFNSLRNIEVIDSVSILVPGDIVMYDIATSGANRKEKKIRSEEINSLIFTFLMIGHRSYQYVIDLTSMKLVRNFQNVDRMIHKTNLFDLPRNIEIDKNPSGTYLTFSDLTTGKEVLKRIDLGNDEFALIHPSGKFDATPGALDQMSFVLGTTPVSLRQLQHRFREYDLWEKVMKHQFIRAPNLDSVSLFPKAQLKMNAKEERLDIHLENQGGGFGEVRIMVDGIELERFDLSDSASIRDSNYDFSFDLKPYRHFFSSEQADTLQVITTNNDKITIESPGYSVTYRAPGLTDKGGQSAAAQTTTESEVRTDNSIHGVFIGVSEYADADLKFSAKDASTLHSVLGQAATSFWADKDKVNFDLLAETGSPTLAPNKANIKKAILSHRDANPEDLFVLFFSGHGVSLTDRKTGDDTYYLLTEDASLRGIESNIAEIDPDFWNNQVVSNYELIDWLNQIPARKKVIIIDACGAGATNQGFASILGKSMGSGQKAAFDQMVNRTGIYILAGSAADQKSYETSNLEQSFLTYSLLKGLKTGGGLYKNESEKLIDIDSWFNYAVDDVPAISASYNVRQEPFYSRSINARRFSIGRITDDSEVPLTKPKPVFMSSSTLDRIMDFDLHGINPEIDRELKEQELTDGKINFDRSADQDSYQIRGRYTIEGKKVSLRCFVLSTSEKKWIHKKPEDITGSMDDLSSLAKKVVAWAEKLVVAHHALRSN